MATLVLVSGYVTIHTIVVTMVMNFFMLKLADIDECLSSPCGHTCTNNVGSFVCSCNDGYVLDSDQLSCNGTYAISFIFVINSPPLHLNLSVVSYSHASNALSICCIRYQ